MNQSISSRAVSRARMSRSPGNVQDSEAQDQDSGENSHAYFAFFDRRSSSWKTPQGCFLTGWETFSETWPASGTMRNGRVWKRKRLVPRTRGIESLSLPSLCASEGEKSGYNQSHGKGAQKRYTITALMRRGAIPSLLSSEGMGGSQPPEKRRDGGHTPRLRDVLGGMPNPQWLDWYQGLPVGWTRAIKSRVKRIAGLGNCVVPQVAEWIGRRIISTLMG